MSITTKELLHLAAAKNTAVIGFECIDYNMVYALAEASYESGIPAIAMVDPATCIDKNDCHECLFLNKTDAQIKNNKLSKVVIRRNICKK